MKYKNRDEIRIASTSLDVGYLEYLKAWRSTQDKLGKPSDFNDFWLAHGACPRCYGKHIDCDSEVNCLAVKITFTMLDINVGFGVTNAIHSYCEEKPWMDEHVKKELQKIRAEIQAQLSKLTQNGNIV